MVGIFYQQLYIWHNCSIMRCTYTNPKPKLKLNVTFDPQRCQKHNASHYGAHLTTYDQVAQYSTCTCGSDPLLLALVVFFHSQLAYLLYCHVVVLLLLALVVFSHSQLAHLLYCHMWWSYCYLHCVVVVVVVVCSGGGWMGWLWWWLCGGGGCVWWWRVDVVVVVVCGGDGWMWWWWLCGGGKWMWWWWLCGGGKWMWWWWLHVVAVCI